MAEKSSRWAFTAYEQHWSLFKAMPPGVAEWGWNTEICPKTNRTHYQGYMRLSQQQRFTWVRKILPGVHVEIAKNWDALVNYCKKEDTRAPGTEPTSFQNDIPTQFTYSEEIAKRIYVQYETNPTIEEFNYNNWTLEEAMTSIDTHVRSDIASGRRGVEWIASNPNWKVMWKAYWAEVITRAGRQTDRQTSTINLPASIPQYAPPSPPLPCSSPPTSPQTPPWASFISGDGPPALSSI